MFKFTVYQDEAGEWRWQLRHGNHLIIADSAEGYEDVAHPMEMIGKLIGMNQTNTSVEFEG